MENGQYRVTRNERYLYAFLIVVLDLLMILIPLGAVFLAVVLLARPKWVKKFVDGLYADKV